MNTDVTSKENRGKVNIRRNDKRGTSRIRFSNVQDESIEILLSALGKARIEGDTEYDKVALTYICQQYLSCA